MFSVAEALCSFQLDESAIKLALDGGLIAHEFIQGESLTVRE